MGVFNFEDELEGNFDAAIGKSSESDGHVDHFYFAATQSEGETIAGGIVPTGDAHGAGGGNHVFDSIEGDELDSREVVGAS